MQVALASWTTVDRTRKAEVGNLQAEVLVKQQVLQLEIAMSDTFLVAVGQAKQSLPHVVASYRLIEACGDFDQVENLSVLCELEDTVLDTLALTFALVETLALSYQADHVLVRQLSHVVELSDSVVSNRLIEITFGYFDSNLLTKSVDTLTNNT